jgi:hypothetical protein
MGHVTEKESGIRDNLVGLLALDVTDETNTTGIFLQLRVVESLSYRERTGPGLVLWHLVVGVDMVRDIRVLMDSVELSKSSHLAVSLMLAPVCVNGCVESFNYSRCSLFVLLLMDGEQKLTEGLPAEFI